MKLCDIFHKSIWLWQCGQITCGHDNNVLCWTMLMVSFSIFISMFLMCLIFIFNLNLKKLAFNVSIEYHFCYLVCYHRWQCLRSSNDWWVLFVTCTYMHIMETPWILYLLNFIIYLMITSRKISFIHNMICSSGILDEKFIITTKKATLYAMLISIHVKIRRKLWLH